MLWGAVGEVLNSLEVFSVVPQLTQEMVLKQLMVATEQNWGSN